MTRLSSSCFRSLLSISHYSSAKTLLPWCRRSSICLVRPRLIPTNVTAPFCMLVLWPSFSLPLSSSLASAPPADIDHLPEMLLLVQPGGLTPRPASLRSPQDHTGHTLIFHSTYVLLARRALHWVSRLCSSLISHYCLLGQRRHHQRSRLPRGRVGPQTLACLPIFKLCL
jgi:hypothetical protein